MMSPPKYPSNNPHPDQAEGASYAPLLGTSIPLPMFEDTEVGSQRELGAVPKANQGRNSNLGLTPLGNTPNPPTTPMIQRTGKMDPFVIKQTTMGRD